MNILVVESSSLFYEILEETLSHSGIKLMMADSATMAMQKLKTQKIDLICVSLFLTDTTGNDFALTVREIANHKHTPILLLTPESPTNTAKTTLPSGITEVFHKKDIGELTRFIQRLSANQQPLSGSILYVDSNPIQQQLVTKILHAKGLDVDDFTDEDNAWHAFLDQDYDLVIIDSNLQKPLTGITFVNQIRRLESSKGNTPILAISELEGSSQRVEPFYLGINDYLIKPLIPEELIARIRNLITSKQFYIESMKQRKRAETADQSKSQFIAYISHELRTPLNAILGFSSLLLTDTKTPIAETHKTNINEINNAGEHLLSLMNDFLDISTIEAGEIKFNITKTVISKEVKQIVARLSGLATKKGIDIKSVNIANDITVKADKFRLQQVLLNLVSNAIKYNKTNGHIKVLCKPLSNGYIRVGVTDTGIGLTEQEQQQLFHPFNRINQNNTVQGTGLGLIISKRLVEGMHGEIGFKSTKGVGSTFWIDLPST